MEKKLLLRIAVSVTIVLVALMSLIRSDLNSMVHGVEESSNQVEQIINNIIPENEVKQDNTNNEIIIGTLEIEKIDMQGIVKEGSTSDVLENYIGHIENTPRYDGNVCLAAHNRGNIYSFFSRINELENGDKLCYTTSFGTKYYEVNNIQEIDETDWSLLQNTNENKLTLITCVKDKKDKRLCVQGIEIDKDKEEV